MQTWEEELQAFRRRTRKSARAWEAAKRFIPSGVSSNYRLVDPYPLYVRRAKGSRLWDADDNEYVDFHVDRLKFSMTGLDATLFSVRLARAVTGRRRILKFEGCYHGSHDALMVSIKPRREASGDPRRPNPVPASKGLLKELVETAVVAPFNDLASTEAIATEHADAIAGIILEPVPMNMGYVQPKPGFLEGLRALADRIGAVLIFDEVKTCGKWYGGAEEAC